MAGSDPALACGCLQRFEVVLQAARSGVRVVGGAQQHSCAPCCTAFPALCTPPHTQCGTGAASASGGQTSQKRREGWRVSPMPIAFGGGWCRNGSSTPAPRRWVGSEQRSVIPAGNSPSHLSALPVTSSSSFASSAPPAAPVPLPGAGPALPRQIPAPWPSWCSWL